MSIPNYLPENYSVSVLDAYDFDPTLLDNFVLDTDEHTDKFKKMFIARWGTYGIGAQTVPTFKLLISNKFTIYADYYIELLKWQEQVLSNQDHSFTQEKTYIDLPNKKTDVEYATNKERLSYDDSLDEIQRKLLRRDTIINILADFVDEFKDCMCLVYY